MSNSRWILLLRKISDYDRMKEINMQLEEKIILLNNIIKDKDIDLKELKSDLIVKDEETNRTLIKANNTIEQTNKQCDKLTSYVKELEKIMFMDIEELRKYPCNYPAPQLNKESTKWETTTAYCSIGGCEYRYFSNNNEREALLQGIIASLKGERVETRYACSSCYNDYMRDCI